MPVVDTEALQPGVFHPANDQVYNGLDACITLEVFEEITRERTPPLIYAFSRALQAPVLSMMRRGFKVDEYERQRALDALRERRELLDGMLQQFADAVWDRSLNANSPKQLGDFFVRTMHLPQPYVYAKGVKRASMNRESLESLALYLHARPIVYCILAIRDVDKQAQDLRQTTEGGRYFTSFNIAGTESWRFSSSKSARGTGGNIQNKKRDDDITKKCPNCEGKVPERSTCQTCEGEGKIPSDELSLRRPFVADPGWKLCEIDLEQAESREVGWELWRRFGDDGYLRACEGGDLHTTVARMTWPELEWTDDAKHNRKVAEQLYYRNNTYRDMAKKLGHGSNYYGQPYTMAHHAKIPTRMAQAFQERYFEAFPGIPKWHRACAEDLQIRHEIVNSFAVARTFFGRDRDDATLREAIAHGPQSATAMRTNLGLWRMWKWGEVQLLAQKHDSVTFQFVDVSPEYEVQTVKHAMALMSTPLKHSGRTFDVPCDAKIGYNWGAWDAKINPNGMRKWRAGEPDPRRRLEGLERPL